MTLAQLKRDLKEGTELKVVSHFLRSEDIGTIKTVVKVQGNGIFTTKEGTDQKVFLELPTASLLDYNGESFSIYERRERDLTESEQMLIDNMPSKRPENKARLEMEIMTDTDGLYWKDKAYFAENDANWYYETSKGKRHSNGKMKDNSIKGQKLYTFSIIK